MGGILGNQIITIKNYTLQHVIDSMNFLLDKASHSPEVRQHAIQITGYSEDKIYPIYSWVKKNLRYVSDPQGIKGSIELFISPVKMVEWYNKGISLGGDCDDHALLLTGLYKSIGLKSNIVIVDVEGKGYDHAYSQVWSDKLNMFIAVDTVSKYPLGWEISNYGKIVI